MSARQPLDVRLYRALARLLPPQAAEDVEEMTQTFAELGAEAHHPALRWARATRSLAALAVVVALEWLEHLGVRGAPGRTSRRVGSGMGRNLRYALRTMRRAPAFAATSVLLIAVGVGAVTTIFTLVDHVLLRPLPYPESERLVALDDGGFAGPLFRGLETLGGVERWAGAATNPVTLVGEGEPVRLTQSRVSEGFFELFGGRAAAGRILGDDDFAAADAVVLDAGAWRRVWGADPSIVGQTIRVDGEPLRVVGVMDAGFSAPEALVGRSVDLWRPLDWASESLQQHEFVVLQIAGRLAEGVALPAVQAEVDALLARMSDQSRNYRTREGGPRSVPVLPLAEMTVRGVRTGLGLLMGAVGLLLLVACANVANLFLARGLGRTREMAVRRAMGAGTMGLTGQLLIESLVVGLGGGLLGTGLAALGIRAFVTLNPTALPRQAAVEMDPRVVAFAVAVSALTSVVFGLVPALRSVRGELADELRGASRTSTSGRSTVLLRNALVTGEIALSLVLVTSAGLLVRTFFAVQAQSPGFAVEDVWTVPLDLAAESPEQYRQIMDEVVREVEAIPGVGRAAYGLSAPLQHTGTRRCCWNATPGTLEDGTERPGFFFHPVTSGYLATLGTEIVAGRSWSVADATAEPVPFVVNETLARALAATADAAIGMSLEAGGFEGRIVGVAADSRHYGLDQTPEGALYLPMERLPFPFREAALVVRADPAVGGTLAPALRDAVWAVAPAVPVSAVVSMRDAVDASTAVRRFDSLLFAAFAAAGLLLAAGGLYGTLLYMAGQRRREIGIRVALGASRRRIEAQVLRVGVALGATGIGLGMAAAWTLGRFLESRLWGVERGDPLALGGAALLLLATAALASWLPARRAGRYDPVESLRAE